MSMTNYLENKILNHIANNEAYVQPSELYVGLLTNLTNGEEGTATEVTGAGYERVRVSLGQAENGIIKNDTDVEFAVAQESWGAINAVAIYDAVTGGNMLFHTNLSSSQQVGKNNQILFKSEKIEITLD